RQSRVVSTLERLRPPRGLRRHAFGHADEKPFRRLTGDAIRVGVAAVLLALSAAHYTDHTQFDQDVERAFADLPDGLHGLFAAFGRVGAVWAVLLVAAAAFLARRWRLAAALAVAGGGAWFAARFMGFVVAGVSPGDAFVDVFHTSKQPLYPTVPLAVIAAVIATAAPFLTRPVRRLGQFFVLLTALGTLYQGTGSLNAVIAGLLVGWGIAALVHLVLGSPAGRPTMAQVASALD